MLTALETPVATKQVDPIADLVCEKCERVLAHVYDHQGKTAMHLIGLNGALNHILRAEIGCPQCGAVKMFYSAPASGVRLGIVEA